MSRAAKTRILARLGAGAAIAATLLTVSGCDSQKTGDQSAPAGVSRQVTVTGKGQVQGVPDTLTINASTNGTAADATGAINTSGDAMRRVLDALNARGVAGSDVVTTNVTLSPQYGPDGTQVIGYQAGNAIQVTVRDITTASNILDLITSTGGNALRISSVNYSIDDDSQLVRDARTRAFSDAKDRAQQFADLSGMSLGRIVSISETSEGSVPTPTPAPRMMAAMPTEPGQQTVGFTVTVVWEVD